MTAGFVKHYRIEKYSPKLFVSGSLYKWRKVEENDGTFGSLDGHRGALQNMFETVKTARMSKLRNIGSNRAGGYLWMADENHDDKDHIILRIHKDDVGADHSFAHYYRVKEKTGDDSVCKWKYYQMTLTPWAIFKELSQHHEKIAEEEEKEEAEQAKAVRHKYHLYSSRRETDYEWNYRGTVTGENERDALSNWFIRMDVPEMLGKLTNLYTEPGVMWFVNKADIGEGCDGLYRVCNRMDHETNWGHETTSTGERQKWN